MWGLLRVPRTGIGAFFETLAPIAPQNEVRLFCHAQTVLILGG